MAMNTCRGAPAVLEREEKGDEETDEANDLVQITAAGREEQIQGEDDQPRHQDGHVGEQGSRAVQQSRGVHASLLVLRPPRQTGNGRAQHGEAQHLTL